MANEEHLAILSRGTAEWNAWRAGRPDRPDLTGANLYQADLAGANLEGTDLRNSFLDNARLSGANLTKADLSGVVYNMASLQGVNLEGAKLDQANLNYTDLSRATLRGATVREAAFLMAHLGYADLSHADLSYADLRQADLSSANLERAQLSGVVFNRSGLYAATLREASCLSTVFAAVDLSQTRDLDTVHHSGPSTIGIDTIYASGGKIPEAFLRGCGVPDSFIAYVASLVGKPFDFYSCFISHSHKDEEFARRLHSRMQQEHLRVWYSPVDMEGGKKLHEQVDVAIRLHDKLLLLLSPNSMASEWVKTEVYKARQRELKEKRQVLFPISLVPFEEIRNWEFFDADTGKDLGREIREYFIPDFSKWKDHDAFEKAFARLLHDLQAKPQQET